MCALKERARVRREAERKALEDAAILAQREVEINKNRLDKIMRLEAEKNRKAVRKKRSGLTARCISTHRLWLCTMRRASLEGGRAKLS